MKREGNDFQELKAFLSTLELLSIFPHSVQNSTEKTTPRPERLAFRRPAPSRAKVRSHPRPHSVTGGAAVRQPDLRLLALPAGSRRRFRLLSAPNSDSRRPPGKPQRGPRGRCRNS